LGGQDVAAQKQPGRQRDPAGPQSRDP